MKIFVFIIVCILSFIIFESLLEIPFTASYAWLILAWIFLNTIFALIFLAFDTRLNKEKLNELKNYFKKKNYLALLKYLLFPFLNATIVTFFMLVIIADITMYFAKTPFTKQVVIKEIQCHLPFGGYYSPLPHITSIEFIDSKNGEIFHLSFQINLCGENPTLVKNLHNKQALLIGRQWFFGKYYDHIALER